MAAFMMFLAGVFTVGLQAQTDYANPMLTPELREAQSQLGGDGRGLEFSPPIVWIQDYCGFERGIAEFSVYVENDVPLSAMQFDLLLDSEIWAMTGISLDERAHQCFANYSDIDGGLRVAIICAEIDTGSGPLITFHFDEPEGLVCGDTIVFEMNVTLVASGDSTFQIEGLLAILPVRYLGDLSGDCEINVLDVLRGIDMILRLPPWTECQIWTFDVNEDGQTNILDVLAIVDIILGYGYPEKGIRPSDPKIDREIREK